MEYLKLQFNFNEKQHTGYDLCGGLIKYLINYFNELHFEWFGFLVFILHFNRLPTTRLSSGDEFELKLRTDAFSQNSVCFYTILVSSDGLHFRKK